MCIICAEYQPWTDGCTYGTLTEAEIPADGSITLESTLPVFDMDQIALQLTEGYGTGRGPDPVAAGARRLERSDGHQLRRDRLERPGGGHT